DEALGREDGVLGVGDGLAPGLLADQHVAVGLEGDDRRRGATTLFVGDDLGLIALHHSDDGVGGPEVDTDNLAHWCGVLSGCGCVEGLAPQGSGPAATALVSCTGPWKLAWSGVRRPAANLSRAPWLSMSLETLGDQSASRVSSGSPTAPSSSFSSAASSTSSTLLA